jgi:hypothetical protein
LPITTSIAVDKISSKAKRLAFCIKGFFPVCRYTLFSTLVQFLLPLVVIMSVYYRIYTYVKVQIILPSLLNTRVQFLLPLVVITSFY